MNFIEHNYEELYDLKNDPHETLNLAKDLKYNTVIKELRTKFTQRKAEIAKPD